MQIFRGFLPLVGESGYRYLPWLTLTVILSLLIVVQLYGTSKINGYYHKTIRGQNQAGKRLLQRLKNAEWNDEVREFCKSNGLVIVKHGQTDSEPTSVTENAV